MKQLLNTICKERPVGTTNNSIINNYLEHKLSDMKFNVKSLPFECTVWENDSSHLNTGNEKINIYASPYSEGINGDEKLVFADSLATLEQLDCTSSILLLGGELTKEQIQPKDYPFYFPDEHKQFISLLEQKAPKAIVALTDKQPLCGLSPFPLFEDGSFKIPSAYLDASYIELLKKYIGKTINILIDSRNYQANSQQLVATKCGKNKNKKIVICAHMDTKYNTPGALDNAAGIAVMMTVAERLIPDKYSIDIVPFNGEEYYGACGELEYLQYLSDNKDTVELLINIDSPCHIDSRAAVSFYNFNDNMKTNATRLFEKHPLVCEGQQWYAGDHCAFIFGGTPCIAVSSSDLFEGGLEHTHTPMDTLNDIDISMIMPAAEYITALVRCFNEK